MEVARVTNRTKGFFVFYNNLCLGVSDFFFFFKLLEIIIIIII
jgi:hypothetical protein